MMSREFRFIKHAMKNDEYVPGVFLDFSKAFGMVDHNILMQKWNLLAFEELHWSGWGAIYKIENNNIVVYNSSSSCNLKLSTGSSTEIYVRTTTVFN